MSESGRKYALVLINRHPETSVSCTVNLGERSLDGNYPATLLTAESPDTYNDIEHPDRITPKRVECVFKDGVVSLPPHSLMIVQIAAGN